MNFRRFSDRFVSSRLLVYSTKSVYFLARFFGLGSGSTWPGELTLCFKSNFISEIIKKNPHLKIILVSGTNGKTTCTTLIAHVLSKKGYKVFSNQTGANLANGIASTLIARAGWEGKINFDCAVFEVDENVLPHLVKEFTPTAVLALNLFRDQLDRYGEIDSIKIKWQQAFSKLPSETALILNGQDPHLFYLGKSLKRKNLYQFGLDKEKMLKNKLPPEADLIFCPKCQRKLDFSKIAYSHIGIFNCSKCGKNNDKFTDLSTKIENPLLGLFNQYNISAVALLLHKIFQLTPRNIETAIQDFKPVFGRQETLYSNNIKFLVQLSKNPVGFNQSIDLLENDKSPKKQVLLILNDNIPDGRDISWIWDVDFERLVKIADKIYISGVRAYDLAVRLKYAQRKEKIIKDNLIVSDNLDEIIKKITQSKTKFIYAFPVYSAMLDLRKKLTGTKIKP